MEFLGITSEIKTEPEFSLMDRSEPDTPPDVSHEESISITASPEKAASGADDDDAMLDTLCIRMEQAVAEGEQADSSLPLDTNTTTTPAENPPLDDVELQDSGGVFKDHNYSVYKELTPVDKLLATYNQSRQTTEPPLSEHNRNICKILELLGTIVSTPSAHLISGAIGMIEIYTSELRTQFNDADRKLERIYSEHEYLRGVRDMGLLLSSEVGKVAGRLLEKEEGEEKEESATPEEFLSQLKVSVHEKLRDFNAVHHLPRTAEGTTQTDPPSPETVKEEFGCQTDPPSDVTPIAQPPLRYFTSSDLDTDSSLSSGSKRKRRRKRKKEMLAEFFEREGGKGEDEESKRRREASRKAVGVVRGTGSDDEIDRLVNFNHLDRDYGGDGEEEEGDQKKENNAPKTTAEGTEKEKVVKDTRPETVEDILNGLQIENESEGDEVKDEEEKEEEDEEKQFLKALNLEHKLLLLSSSSGASSGEEEDSKCDLLLLPPKKVTADSDEDSETAEAVELFLNDFTVDKMDKKEEEKERRKLRERDKKATGEDGVEKVRQNRDSFDQEMAELLKDTDEDEEEGEGKEVTKGEKRANKTVADGEDDETSPLDLSDTVGKRSRNESLDNAASEEDLLLNKRKRIFLNPHCTEKVDALVVKAHQSSKNPLLVNRPAPTPSPAVSSVTSRDPDCISLSSSSSIEELTAAGTSSVAVAGGGAAGPSSSTDQKTEEPAEWKHRNTRKMISDDKLDINTQKAQRDESERIKRLERKQEVLRKYMTESGHKHKGEIVLDVDPKTKQVVRVHPDIVKHLKEHQVQGIKFLYDCAYGSVVDMEKHPGSGCILAHCMGLGKTLQQITVMHTVVQYPELKTNRILVICPKSTVMNWVDEVQRWVGHIQDGVRLKVFYIPDQSDILMRVKILKQWHKCGEPGYAKAGVMLLGHEAFRILVLKQREEHIDEAIKTCLLNPGPDLVICDEGHVIKNPKSAISQAVSKLRTAKRIVLTGTPIQNNLKEYFCMVSFIKPMFLGTLREFSNLYANPIKSGQHKDSTLREIKVMQQRSYVLHKKLEKFVQRREAGTLKQFLPEKFEYVIFVPLTEVQERLYRFFLAQNPAGEWNGKSLISDYTFLRKIWTHPKVLESAYQNAIAEQQKQKAKEKERKRRENAESEDDVPDDVLDKRSDALSVTNDWWRTYLKECDLESLFPSHKLRIMFEILKLCRENGEKCLIFSAFVAVLNVVEYFMAKIHQKDARAASYGLDNLHGPWEPGVNYYRLDGRTSKNTRHMMIKRFNDPENRQVSAFLISAKAGGMGINLTGANRVIILDTSWNPSNDQQNIFRVFRLGQRRNCYIYRLLAMGTMEEKVYSRSVTKQALSYRVVDEQQIDRHYNMAELAELYVLQMPDFRDRPVPIRPSDRLLANLVHNCPEVIFKYHVHDSLLENKPEEHLSEAEKRQAWFEYEQQERKNEPPLPTAPMMQMPDFNGMDYRTLSHTMQLAGYGGLVGMGGGGGVGASSGASPFLSMLGPYANDPYLQMMYGGGGLGGGGAGGAGGGGMSGYNPMALTGGNRYFTSGSLFPPDNSSGMGTGGGLPMPSTSGGVADGKKGNKGANRTSASATAALKRAMNFAALSQQMASYDPSYLWGGAGGGGKNSNMPPSPHGHMVAAAAAGAAVAPPGSSPPGSSSPMRPRVVRIPTPPPFIPMSSGLSPPTTATATTPPQQQLVPKKRPRILTKAPTSTAVALPPSTTIEKLPLTTAAALPMIKSPILPSVPQSITVEKVVGGGGGGGSQVKRPPLSNRNLLVGDRGKVLEPATVIDLIDDVIDANPGLTVKPIQLQGGAQRGTAVMGASAAVNNKTRENNFGINYPEKGVVGNKGTTTTNVPSTAAGSVPSTGKDPLAITPPPPLLEGVIKRPQQQSQGVTRTVPAATTTTTTAEKKVASSQQPRRTGSQLSASMQAAMKSAKEMLSGMVSGNGAAGTSLRGGGAVDGAAPGKVQTPQQRLPPVGAPQRAATQIGIIRTGLGAKGQDPQVPRSQPLTVGQQQQQQRKSLPNLQAIKGTVGANKKVPATPPTAAAATSAAGDGKVRKQLLQQVASQLKAIEDEKRGKGTTAGQQSRPVIVYRQGSAPTAQVLPPRAVTTTTNVAAVVAGAPKSATAGTSAIVKPLQYASPLTYQQQLLKNKRAGRMPGSPTSRPQMKTVTIQHKGRVGSPRQQGGPVRLPVLAMTSPGVGGGVEGAKRLTTAMNMPTATSPIRIASSIGGVGLPKSPSTQFTLKPMSGGSQGGAGGQGVMRMAAKNGGNSSQQRGGVAAGAPRAAPQKLVYVAKAGTSSPVRTGNGQAAATAPPSIRPLQGILKRPAVVPTSDLGPAAKKVTATAPTTTAPVAPIKKVVPAVSSTPPKLTVIQKNLQKRQNGSMS